MPFLCYYKIILFKLNIVKISIKLFIFIKLIKKCSFYGLPFVHKYYIFQNRRVRNIDSFIFDFSIEN